MNAITKIAMGLIAVGGIATLVLPGRQTPAVLTGVTKLFTGSLSTAQGTSSGAID